MEYSVRHAYYSEDDSRFVGRIYDSTGVSISKKTTGFSTAGRERRHCIPGPAGSAKSHARQSDGMFRVKAKFCRNNAFHGGRIKEHRSQGKTGAQQSESAGKKAPEYQEQLVLESSGQDASVLYQGRKNHDHLSSASRKYKKHDDAGVKTLRSRDSRAFMVALQPINQQFDKEEKEPGGQDAVKQREQKPGKNGLDGLNEAFRQHLSDVVLRSVRYEKYCHILSDRAHRCSDAENSRSLKTEIAEGLQEYQHRLPLPPVVDWQNALTVDPEYEAALQAEYEHYEQSKTDQYYRNLESDDAYEKEVPEMDRCHYLQRLTDKAEADDNESGLSFEDVYDVRKKGRK